MRSHYPRGVMRQPRALPIAMSTQHQSNGIVVMVAYALMTGIIALWVAQLSPVTGYVLSKLNIVPDNQAPFSSVVNYKSKGDRLPGITFQERWNSLGTSETMRPSATMPNSCTWCGGKTNLKTRLAIAGTLAAALAE